MTKVQRQLTGLENNVDKGANLIFLSTIIPIPPRPKDIHSKTSLFALPWPDYLCKCSRKSD